MNIITRIFKLHRYGFTRQEVCEMNLDGDIYRVYTYEDGFDDYPVFHVIPVQTYEDICVCLFEPRYYQWNQCKYRFNPFRLDLFNEELKKQNKLSPNLTNWETILMLWKWDHKVPEKYKNITQPDYTKLDDTMDIKRSLKQALISKWNA